MKRQTLLLMMIGVAISGCAKYPAAGSSTSYTRLHFSFTTKAAPNSNFLYIIPIRILTPAVGTDSSLSDESNGPIPVVGTGTKNGIVGGLPTHYVIYDPTASQKFHVYRFPTQTPTTSDPAAINLSWPGDYIGDVYNADVSAGSEGYVLSFDINTSYLAYGTIAAQDIQTIQFNVIMVSKRIQGSSDLNLYEMDALGNQSFSGQTFNAPYKVNIITGGTYTSAGSTYPETANDVFIGGSLNYDPELDLVDWSLQVTPP